LGLLRTAHRGARDRAGNNRRADIPKRHRSIPGRLVE
tara:strand:- start:8692 stop:8802 length:111 start_codon:yes stop_codon:yes gene_type:complete